MNPSDVPLRRQPAADRRWPVHFCFRPIDRRTTRVEGMETWIKRCDVQENETEGIYRQALQASKYGQDNSKGLLGNSPSSLMVDATLTNGSGGTADGASPAVNGTSAAPSASTSTSTTSERFPAPPTDTLSILKTFMETQERRVNLWKEYEEAMEGHLTSREELPSEEAAAAASTATHSHDHGHYDSTGTRVSLQDSDLMTRIISLVTSGLLDCSHETRTIATQLSSNDDGDGDGAAAARLRPDLARLIGKIQDTENAVLRAIVKRDTIRRTAKGEERELTAQEQQEVQELTAQVKTLRDEKIQEYVDDIRAEMTDLQISQE